MSLATRKRTILAKIESVYGTDPTPDGTANAILVRNLSVTPINAEQVSRDNVRPYYGNSDTLLAQVSVACEFEIELAGAITKGIAPAWAPLLKACGFAETLNTSAITITRSSAVATATKTAHGLAVGESVKISGATETEYNGTFTVATVPTADTFTYAVSGTPTTPATGSPVLSMTAVYAPISSSIPSVTLYYNVDGLLHKVTGARGNVEFTLNVKQIPVMKFSFTGIYNAPSDTAAPTCVFTAFQAPKVVNTANTASFSLLSFSGYLESLGLNMTNDVQYRTLVGFEEVILADRKPAGTMVIEAPTIASKDFFTAAKNGTTGALAITHGTANGNKVALAAPRVSIGNPGYQDSQGVQMLSIPFVISPQSGNDELSITVS
jgi:hypothetical protein